MRYEQGTLLVDEGSTRYVSHELLVTLGTQLSQALDGELTTADATIWQAWREVPLAQFHPSDPHGQLLWKVFDDNVAPVTMVFHRSSIHQAMTSVAADGGDNDPARDVVASAAYFATVTSLNPAQCVETFGQHYSSLQQHYRFATQQALARANFFESQNLAVLQATTLFLACLRHPKDASFVLSMAAVVHWTAQRLGLHRDGTTFGRGPFQVEIRRRLWRSIYLLDSRSPEFYAMGPQIARNSDISPDMTKAPDERTGFTDMTFCLIRCEMTVLYRRFHLPIPQYCDVSLPLQWVTATVIRLALTRSWLLAHIPEAPITKQIPQLGISVAEDPVPRELFVAAIEVVEFAYLLETDPRTKQWSWLLECYPRWHSLSLVNWARSVATQAVPQWMAAGFQNGGSGITPKIVVQLTRRAASALGPDRPLLSTRP
ncbi:hypothetical protein BJX68DRAFT_275882 [Aspergillus pseudodeflectus]|uniref:Xylanolytic transcriptional activator regulatory domain-containing protein n=1 Tax=Aspergillus pseudodeflectus TaxID=176178 RepID=A0ABR4KEE5_9EURO